MTANRTRVLLGLTLFAFLVTGRAEDEDILTPEKLPSLWVKDFDLRAWSGYKDNVLLSNRNLVGSPLIAAGLDMTFFRLPANGWEYSFLTSAEYTRYPSADQANDEAMVIAQAQAKKSFNSAWRTGLSAEYLYFKQVFDNTVFGSELSILPVQAHGFTLRPSVGRDFGKSYHLDLELPGTRQVFDEFIDDYWEFGPKLILSHDLGRRAELALSYQFNDRLHDSREARDADGTVELGRGLKFFQHEISGSWRQFWDAKRRWRTVTRLSLQRNEDNGGGYYSFLRPALTEQLRYRGKAWEAQLDCRLSYYHYDDQHITDLNSPLREKAYVRVNLRGERALTKTLKLFAQYEYERSLSNVDLDEYIANTVWAGIDWQF